MPESLSLRAAAVFRAALPGILHEFSSPLSVLRSDADYLAHCRDDEGKVDLKELAEIGAELDDVASRFALLLGGFKAIPDAKARDRSLDDLLSSVLSVLRNELKYEWTTTVEVAPSFIVHGPAFGAWVALAEFLLALCESFPKGGRLDIRSSEEGLAVVVAGAAEGKQAQALRARFYEWAATSPFTLRSFEVPSGGSPGLTLFLVNADGVD